MNCEHCQHPLGDQQMDTCPHCGQPLASADAAEPGATLDSHLTGGSSQLMEEPDVTLDSAQQSASGSNEATFLFDELPEHEGAGAAGTVDYDAAEDAGDAGATVVLGRSGDAGSEESSEPAKDSSANDGSSQPDAASPKSDPLPSGSDVGNTLHSEEFAGERLQPGPADAERTIMSDQFDESGEDDAARTMISHDADERESAEQLKTIASNFDESLGDDPAMTIKSGDHESMDSLASDSKFTFSVPRRTLRSNEQLTPQTQLAEYELLQILGEGGMGVVWSARQTSVDRNVAVKMIKGAQASNKSQRQKFLAEAIVTGDLDHPNIVPIYDVGTDDAGTLFYSMKQVKGTPWNKVIKTKSQAENVEILLRVADAISFSHSRNIIHRDLKPENIMLGEYGEVLVMDWGLALATGQLDKARQLRQSTGMGGTPAYMAPEMATGPIERITPLSDLYLLGAILYEILTGVAPHPGKKVRECLLAAMRNQIKPTEKSGELMSIAMQAMATDPNDRFASVREFQAAIRESLSHSESVAMAVRAQDDLNLARSSDQYSDFAKAVFGFEEAYELWKGNDTARDGVDTARIEYAESALRKGDYDLGTSLLDEGNPRHQNVLQKLDEAKAERAARQQRLQMAKRLIAGMAVAVFIVVSVAFFWVRGERDKAQLAREQEEAAKLDALDAKEAAVQAAEKEELAKEAALAAQAQEAEQRRKAEQATQQALAAREKEEMARMEAEQATRVAVAAREQEAEARRDAESAKQAEEYEAYIARVGLAAAKIDENAFDVALELLEECPPELRNWEWGRLMHLCQQSSKTFAAGGPVDAVAISPDGTKFVAGTWDHRARVWDIESGQLLHELPQTGLYVHSVSWSPRNDVIVTTGNDADGRIRIWDVNSGKLLSAVNGHTDAVVGSAFSPDGRWLVTTSYDETARLWDLNDRRSPQSVAVLKGHSWWVWNAAFSPHFDLNNEQSENRIVTVSQDGRAIIWNVRATGSGDSRRIEAKQAAVFSEHEGPVYAVAFSPNGHLVATGGYDRKIYLWEPENIPPFSLETLLDDEPDRVEARVLTGHTGPVQALEFAREGQLLVSGGRDNAVKAWSLQTDKAVKTFRGHFSGVRSVAISPDGRRIISGGQDQRSIVWSVDGYEEIRVLDGRQLSGHNDAILNAIFSNDGQKILTASRDRTARTWDADDGQVLGTFAEGHDFLASRAVISPDGRVLITSAADNTVRLWNIGTGTQFLKLDDTGRSATLTMSADANWLVTGSEDDSAKLWDIPKLMEFSMDAEGESEIDARPQFISLAGHNGRVTAAAFSPVANVLLTCDANGRCILRKVPSGEILWNVHYHNRRVNAVAFLPDGSQALTASNDHTVSRLDVATGKEVPDQILKHENGVVTVTISADGKQAVTVDIPKQDGIARRCNIHVWDVASAKQINAFTVEGYTIQNVDLMPDGRSFFAVCSDNSVRRFPVETSSEDAANIAPWIDVQATGGLVWYVLVTDQGDDLLTVGGSEATLWDLDSRKEKMVFSPHGAVAAADFSPDGNHIVTGSWDNSAKIWDTKSTHAVLKLEHGHDGYINSVAYSPDGRFILTASDDRTAKLWNVATGTIVREFLGHTGRVRQAVFSPDGQRILTVSSDKTARLWETATAKPIGKPFTGHRWAVLSGAFSPDGTRILTGSEDNDARLWDVKTGDTIAIFGGHTASVSSVAFLSDGSRVFTGSQDNTAKIWDSTPGHEGKEILTLSGHRQELTSVAVSPNGRQLVTASRDGTAVIWLTSPWSDAPAAISQTRP